MYRQTRFETHGVVNTDFYKMTQQSILLLEESSLLDCDIDLYFKNYRDEFLSIPSNAFSIIQEFLTSLLRSLPQFCEDECPSTHCLPLAYIQIFNHNHIINIRMRPLILKGHERPVTIVRFNYDGDLFFSGSAETKINLWQSYTGERIGSYATRASVRSLDVDINSQYLIACGNDGSLQIFEVKTGKSLKYFRFVYKLKQVQFDYGSNRFLLLHDQYKPQTPSRIKVYNFKTLFNFDVSKDAQNTDKIPMQTDFPIVIPDQKVTNRIGTRTLWYVDNESFFVATQDGWLIHYDIKGNIKNKNLLHEGVKINSIAFSKNFSVLATAADNGSKIVDPETMEIIRYFKQELPMNAVSISPLFCESFRPKFHTVMGGGVSAIMAAMTAGNAGFEAHICNVLHGNEVGKISGHFGPINSIEFFRDGRGFVSGGQEGIIRIVRFSEEYFEENNPQFE